MPDIMERSTSILGLYFSNYYNNDKYVKNDRFLVLSKGLYTIPNGSSFTFETGKEYFLSENGSITCYPRRDISYADIWTRIGVAQSPKQLLVEISKFYFDKTRGEFPVGYTKPLLNRQNVDYGFLAADGSIRIPVEQYPELFNYLKNYFSDEELQVSENITDSNGVSVAPIDGYGMIPPSEP